MGKMVGIAQRDRACPRRRRDIAVPYESQRVVVPPSDRRQPIRRRCQRSQGFSFAAVALIILHVPDHAKPSGLAGPVARLGKLNGATTAVAGFSSPEDSIALAARAALSFFSESSFTAIS